MRMLVVISLLILAGCSSDSDVPKGIIGKDDMGKILWDLMQADQFSLQYMIKDSAKINVKKETIKLYQEVFQVHHVSKDEFQKSFQFYIAHPEITKVMFDSLSARANRQRGEVYRHTPKIKAK